VGFEPRLWLPKTDALCVLDHLSHLIEQMLNKTMKMDFDLISTHCFFFCVKKGDCIRLLFLFCLLVLMMMEILAYVCACALERERRKNWKSDQDSRLLGQLSWPPHLTNDFSGHFFRTRMEQLSPCSLLLPSPSDFICLALSIFLFSIPVCFYFDWCVCAYFDEGTQFPPALWFSVMQGTNIPGQWNLDIGDNQNIAIFVTQKIP